MEPPKDPQYFLDEYLKRSSASYVISHASTPWLLHRQMKVYHAVAGGDDMAVLLDRYNISPTAATATQSASGPAFEAVEEGLWL